MSRRHNREDGKHTMHKAKRKKATTKETKALKVGGLWVDPLSYPALNFEKEDLSSPR